MKYKTKIIILLVIIGLIAGMKILLHDPSWRYHALTSACWNGNANKVRDLLENGADPNGLNDYNLNPTMEFCYPIDNAAWNNHSEIINLLVKAGAEVNVTDSECGSPLMTAAQVGALDATRVLLLHGANTHTKAGDPISEIARRFGHNEIADLIDAKQTRKEE